MFGWNITAFCRRTMAPHFVYHRARIKPRIDARTICYCRPAWRNYPLINNRPSFISSYDEFQLQSWHHPSHSIIRGIKRKILTTTFLHEIPSLIMIDAVESKNGRSIFITEIITFSESHTMKNWKKENIYKKLVLKLYKSKIMANYHQVYVDLHNHHLLFLIVLDQVRKKYFWILKNPSQSLYMYIYI